MVVNLCVSSKYTNPSAKLSLILFKLHTTPEWALAHRTGYFIMKIVQQGLQLNPWKKWETI